MGDGPVEVVVAERKLLELAHGSRWETEKSVLEDDGTRVFVDESCVTIREANETAMAMNKDLIALLHSAGLLDGLLAEAWDNGYGSGKMDTNDDAKRGGKHETENPHRKAGANG